MKNEKVTIGRVVHYVMPGSGACRPAFVTDINPGGDAVLTVFPNSPIDGEGGTMYVARSSESEDQTLGSFWHWPQECKRTGASAHSYAEGETTRNARPQSER